MARSGWASLLTTTTFGGVKIWVATLIENMLPWNELSNAARELTQRAMPAVMFGRRYGWARGMYGERGTQTLSRRTVDRPAGHRQCPFHAPAIVDTAAR